MFNKISAIILCLMLILNTLMLSSCITTGIPENTSPDGGTTNDPSETSPQNDHDSTTSPVINNFEALPETITAGTTSTLTWNVTDATSVNISPDIGPVDMSDSLTVSPATTTDYTLTAINDIGSVDRTITITVNPQTTSELNWSGTWDTNWGTMYLTQSLGKVTGTYSYDAGNIEGSISRNLSGDMLAGTWSEYPSYAPPDDAGDFEFTMSPDFNSFTGRWRYGSSGDWSGDWYGTRVSP